MNIFKQMLWNFPLVCAGSGWLLAQILKVFTGIFKIRKFDLIALLFGTGGMPSSHSAAVTALCVSCGLRYGFDSGYFALGFLFAIIPAVVTGGVTAALMGQYAWVALIWQITSFLQFFFFCFILF